MVFLLFLFFFSVDSFAEKNWQLKDCKKIRFADIGWTDITATTSVVSEIFSMLGYETRTTQLSVPVTFSSLKNQDLDLFLGHWMPSMAADIRPYEKDHSVETLGPLLQGARYTLAVPRFVHEAGVRSIADLSRFKEKFEGRIYGIEPGNDGNRHLQKMIDEDANHLSGWRLVESSEQAMLMEVLRRVKLKKWIVFLAWEPHPMNQKVDLVYLKGAESYFGPNQGSSTVFITSRRNYSKDCPEVVRFLKRVSFTVQSENQLLDLILEQKMDPQVAARRWMLDHWSEVKKWLSSIRSLEGQPATKIVDQKLHAVKSSGGVDG